MTRDTDASTLPTLNRDEKRGGRFLGRHIVNLRFQLKFTLVVLFMLVLSAIATWLIARHTIATLIEGGYVTGDHAVASMKMINAIILQTSGLAFLVTFILAMFFSHFVAGPIYRFERILEEMRDGNLNLYVRLREKDEFKETATLFNDALSSLRKRIQKERNEILESVEKLQALSEDLNVSGRKDEAQQLLTLIADIKNLPPQIKI